MKIKLKIVTRENWEEALKLKVSDEQVNFVPSVAVSLAKVYIKPDGENINYIPFAIYDEEQMIGFIMHAYQENTTDVYWINGFIIDQQYQRQGYGKAALTEMTEWIKQQFPYCQSIHLTVHHDNQRAHSLYQKIGFIPTGIRYGEEDVLKLNL